MRIALRLELKQFLTELRDLRILHFAPQERLLEHLEAERILIPKLRLRYPDAVERRWFADEEGGWQPTGRIEPNGSRWEAACALEEARQGSQLPRWHEDPLTSPDPLDAPKAEWRQFIQHPARRNFVPWKNFYVRVDGQDTGIQWRTRTAVTYYSSWQTLLFIECHTMGTCYIGNTEKWDWVAGDIPSSWLSSGISFDEIRTVQSFRDHQKHLEAVVWFNQEVSRNEQFVLRHSHGRRLIEDDERNEIECRTVEVARRCRKRFAMSYPQAIALIKFLCQRWGHWSQVGYRNHARAYKHYINKAVKLARYLREVPVELLIDEVGRVTGHFKPTLRVIFKDWATEWREDAERILTGFSKSGAILQADFNQAEANSFLDFVEANDVLEFYWRWRSMNERAFSGDANLMAGLKSDLQGMALSIEHLTGAMLKPHVNHLKPTLFEKFKQLWNSSTNVGKLLRENKYRQVAFANEAIDLDWHSERNDQGGAARIAGDLTICHAIRGNAHFKLNEENQLRVERMSVILLRGVMFAFRQHLNEQTTRDQT